ncbi:hypothetical protein [Stappia sp. ES.058]|uniref:hypothetical protein n=1 Tax=Stappia sp. ES.058 TaxID=1881061 RepID=UPI0012FE3D17|nr:hypothetical protein [Stappia sp. ES.058]
MFALLLLASVHIDAAAARATTSAAPDRPAGSVGALSSEALAAATSDAADDADGAVTSTTCPRAGACAGYIVPFAPPLPGPARVRGRHLQVVWQTPTPVAAGRLTPPPR